MKARLQSVFLVVGFVILLASLAYLAPLLEAQAGTQLSATFDSALPSPTPLAPTPTTVPPSPTPTPSEYAKLALLYIADREGLPIEELEVTYEHVRTYLYSDASFMVVKIRHARTKQTFRVLVDLTDNSIVPDTENVERQDAEARLARYGKLDPLLFERLKNVQDGERIQVAIWVGGERGRSQTARYNQLAQRFPEVAAARARHASPFDLPDQASARRVREEHYNMVQEDMAIRTDPLMHFLKAKNVAVEPTTAAPVIVAALTQKEIEQIAHRHDVETIYLAEGEDTPASDVAIPSNRNHSLWNSQIKGAGKTIAIIEAGNVDWDNTYLDHYHERRIGSVGGDDSHATRVASVAASFHPQYTGMAPEATILSSGTHSQNDSYPALIWAYERSADVFNRSAGENSNTSALEYGDRSYDYAARTHALTIIAAAGNKLDRHMRAGAKAWNVITVGGSNDQNTVDWSDDTMFALNWPDGSSY